MAQEVRVERIEQQGEIPICDSFDNLWTLHKVQKVESLKELEFTFSGKYLMKVLSQRISLQFSTYSAGPGIPSEEFQSISFNKENSTLIASPNYKE